MTTTAKTVPHYDQPETEQAYYAELVALLGHYEDGWNVFINAHREKNYDYPLVRKPEHADNPYIPSTWIELTEAVTQIIAKGKYELDMYPNQIEIIRSDQMLDAYTTTGLPYSYRHWSFGKQRMREEKQYDASKHMAYEIVINSNPCISYCMDTNTPLLQLLVIAHAAAGHNAVFKNNYLFQENTDADTILVENQRLRDFIFECEKKYGREEVERLLDFCHAMQFVDTSDKVRRRKVPKREVEQREKDRRVQSHLHAPRVDVFNDHVVSENDAETDPADKPHPDKGERNILGWMAENAPHMPEWKRHIMRARSRLSQYFKPQMMTKMLNEGMASFIHDEILTTMRDIGLVDYGMYQEYCQLNAGVFYQPPGVVIRKNEEGQEEEVLVGARMNPYCLGISILRDLKRICKEPTDEDRQWFPQFAGEADWLSVIKHAVYSSSDQTFAGQYLSPKVMRDLKMLAVRSEEDKPYYEITAIHAGDGFKKLREVLAQNYCIADKLPDITLEDYQDRTDRSLIMRHRMKGLQMLEPNDAELVLEYMHSQWEHPVVLEVIDEDGEVIETFSSPYDYDYRDFKPVGPRPAA